MKEVRNKVDNSNEGCVILLLIPLGLLALVLFVVFVMPVFLIQDKRFELKVKRFLQRNNHTYFFIYSSGRKKAAYCEKQIIPTLKPGVEVVKYDGTKYDRFFEPETYFRIVNPSEKGYPIIGKIEEGKVYTESLKEEFEQLVLKEKEVQRFIDLLYLKMEAL